MRNRRRIRCLSGHCILATVAVVLLFRHSTKVLRLSRTDTKAQISTETLERMQIIQRDMGFVFVQFVNHAYIPLTLNWICHAPLGVLEQTAFFASDSYTADTLRAYKDRKVENVFLQAYRSSQLSYGQHDYYSFMLFRLRLVENLLRARISLWLIESDSTWFSNPSSIIAAYKNMDVIAGQDALLNDSYPEAGNIYLNASSIATRRMILALIAEQQNSLENLRTGHVGNNGNEMLMLPKHLKHVKWSFLPKRLFVGGLWYSNAEFRLSVEPIVIQNNWIVGNKQKIKRAKEWGHWFVDDKLRCKSMSR